MNNNPIHQLKQALIDADSVARKRGDEHGLCDAIDNDGNGYQSQWLHDLLESIRNEGYIGTLTVTEAVHAEKWYRCLRGLEEEQQTP